MRRIKRTLSSSAVPITAKYTYLGMQLAGRVSNAIPVPELPMRILSGFIFLYRGMKLPHHNSSIISFKFQNSSLLLMSSRHLFSLSFRFKLEESEEED